MESEARFTPARPDCPHPERWASRDADSTEWEVSKLVQAFVHATRPDLVVETGTAFGQTTQAMGWAMETGNYGGRIISFEVDEQRVNIALEQCEYLGGTVEIRQEDSLHGLDSVCSDIEDGILPRIGFAWLDSLFELRVPELEIVTPWLADGAIVGIHDCGKPGSTKYSEFSQQVEDAAKRLGFSVVMQLWTPRGVTFLQRG